MIREYPQVLKTAPHFTPVGKVDELSANKNIVVSETLTLPLSDVIQDQVAPDKLRQMPFDELKDAILKAHESSLSKS